jgi:undecaprenyl pyrophosphate synthase
MEKLTIAQAVIKVLQEEKQPMTVAKITQAILDKELYNFNTKDPGAMVRGAVERRCEGMNRRNSVAEKFFDKLLDGRYALK